MPPLTVIGWGALFGPLTWLLCGFQLCMALIIAIFQVVFFGKTSFPDSILSELGGGFLALIGSSVWIIIPFLISLLIDLVKDK
jgi:hypothetical protein